MAQLPDQNGHQVWNGVGKGGSAMPLETLESVPNERLVRKIANPKAPFGGTWTYELQLADGGCRLTNTERGEIYNPIFRLASRPFDLRATIDAYLRALGKKLGEDVELED